MFQFHFGTIDSAKRYVLFKIFDKFQFHFGTIDRCYDNLSCNPRRVSIPLWYD